jgi:carbon-monoxide dehydrogenase large subunit
MLECSAADIDYADARFSVRGTDRGVTFAQVADVAYHGALLPRDGAAEPGLEATVFHDPPDTNDPQAMHLAVVRVDPETGAVTLTDYFAADDCGNVINPMIVEGQVHGGLAQGIGQAMMECVRYDADGQLLTGSLLDYALPRAGDLPFFQTTMATPAPATWRPAAAKAVTIGAPAAIGTAVVDAVAPGVARSCRSPRRRGARGKG